MHWMVEASPENVSQLQGNPNIDHVGEIQIPSLPANTLRFRDTSLIERRAASPEPVEEYSVWARDGKDKEEREQTEEFLQRLLGTGNVYEPFLCTGCVPVSYSHFCFSLKHANIGREKLTSYHVVSTAQREEVAARPSVKAVNHNAKGGYGRHISRHESSILPLSTAKLPNVNAKRGITYATQTDAVIELVEVSQPK